MLLISKLVFYSYKNIRSSWFLPLFGYIFNLDFWIPQPTDYLLFCPIKFSLGTSLLYLFNTTFSMINFNYQETRAVNYVVMSPYFISYFFNSCTFLWRYTRLKKFNHTTFVLNTICRLPMIIFMKQSCHTHDSFEFQRQIVI